jgi:NADH-ubiquinone oxidoreductase chain 1
LGGIRISSQRVSYEIVFSIFILSIVINWKRLSLMPFYSTNILYIIILYIILILSELNRAPFDFAEGERELVRGFNIEYSSIGFVLLFLGEYGFILFFSTVFALLFFNFSLTIVFILFRTIIWIRRRFPRYRYDLLIGLLWFSLLPTTLCIIYFHARYN